MELENLENKMSPAADENAITKPALASPKLAQDDQQEQSQLPEQEDAKHTSSARDPKAALAARMARFKALQAQVESGRKATFKDVQDSEDREERRKKAITLDKARDQAAYKLLKTDDPDFERKRNWDYTAEESEQWDKRMAKKARNRDNNAFQDWRAEANKVYKRQVKNLNAVDLAAYANEKADKLQRQVTSGLLQLVEDPNGDVYTIDRDGRVNTPVEENYEFNHKPSKEAIDKLVNDLEGAQRARLKARAARGLRDEDTSGDVTYINQKNKQFNEKLARFYNRYTTEIRESFERGTAI
jgi:pre-mRNA-splicing factor SYF2